MTKVVIAIAALLAFLFVACGGDGNETPAGTAGPTAAPTATDTTPSSRTGVSDVDAVIEAVLTRDASALRSLVRLRSVACIGPTPSSLGALFCENGETEGNVIDVLPVAQCETHYTRRDELDQVLLFESTIALYSVHTSGDQFSVVFTQQPVAEGPLFGVMVGIDRGLINYVDYGCGQTAAQLVANVPPEDFLISPRDENSTGIPSVDNVIAAIETRNYGMITSMMRFTDVPCQPPPMAAIEVVRCAPGQATGTQVPALLTASCEGTWMTAKAEATDALRIEIARVRPDVYAVYRATPGRAFGFEGLPHVDYVVMLTYQDEDRGIALLMTDAGIVGMDGDCGYPPDEMVELSNLGEALLPPQTPPAPTPTP